MLLIEARAPASNDGCQRYPVVGFERNAIENCCPSTTTICFSDRVGFGIGVGVRTLEGEGAAEGVADADAVAF